MWTDYENETLIHHHKMAKMYKKRYQRASDFHNSLYRIFGLITVLTSTISSTISWGNNPSGPENQSYILSMITTSSAISAAIQNFYKFQENSNDFISTAKLYASLQNKIEKMGNIIPQNREIHPTEFFEIIQNDFDTISEKRKEISNCISKRCYYHLDDEKSFLEEKHEKYKEILQNP
tara:strand:+ start:293 stop:826 length:534 start_codon:yes stop_codon:yes gene_type:complete